MVAFSVYKSSKYLFDCVGASDAASSQPYPKVDSDALEALRIDAADVVKRMDYAEVDKLIACCRQHVRQATLGGISPPQTVVVPATHGDLLPFQQFAKYLKVRQRAGVVLLDDGRLLILAPLEKDDSRLRCVVVKAKPTAGASAALPPNATTIRVDETAPVRPSHVGTQAHAAIALPSPVPEQANDKRRRGGVRPRSRGRTQVRDTVRAGSSTEPNQNNQAEVAAPATAPNKELVLLSSLPRIERATRIAQLRQEYEAFHEIHYDILREWSKSDPDS
ncbi:hypothetical protein PHYPSEUDO_006170 [Phytophthora pseudosyringae]|uniref:Spen paralogue and orthologue SPOC C-terminal domain-containing protein n=1 Tax=Phytophthora pseudosyringae TaxID=221518 RepID=A0A8T1WCT2_9STRA|nr:hypothetical protein PHYPSEUDO_006170 [Phytophthora pseudosyringae]